MVVLYTIVYEYLVEEHAGSADATSCPSSTAPSRRRVARSSLSEPVPAITSRASAYTTYTAS